MIYEYKDTYIVNSIEDDTLLQAETDALIDLEKQGITDAYYLEKMTLCLVYIQLGTLQLEAEGMSDRVTQYRKDYLRYSQMDTFEGTDEGVHSCELGRA